VQTGVADVRLLFAQLKVEFSRLHIKQPLVFIQWKRPDLSTDEIRRIRMGLSGRAAGADGHLAKVVTAVLDELKAA
jgi:hypothetical protein